MHLLFSLEHTIINSLLVHFCDIDYGLKFIQSIILSWIRSFQLHWPITNLKGEYCHHIFKLYHILLSTFLKTYFVFVSKYLPSANRCYLI